jgi:hypothetical protein
MEASMGIAAPGAEDAAAVRRGLATVRGEGP